MNLPELLQWIKFAQKSGTLILEKKGIVKKVFVEKGLIISASSNDPKEYLGQILICFGWISEDLLKEAFRRQSVHKQLLGRVLVEHYDVAEQQILKALRIKIEETVYDLFLWEEGKFIFTEQSPQLQQQERLETAITIDQVIFEGARRVDEWKEFRKSFPNDDVVFKYKQAKKDLGPLAKDFITLKIYDSIDGVRSVQRIILETRTPEYRALEAFGKLFFGDLIEASKKSMDKPQKATELEEPSLLKQAITFYRANDLEKSFTMIEDFVQANPEDTEGRTLYGVVREAYLKVLYAACPLDSIPELGIDMSELNEKVFSSKEGFLHSRVNGEWDVKSLVMVSPLGELESLKILKRLVDEGVIRWKAKGTVHEAHSRS